ncbi:MAG TPA: aldolase catalytic domain-containing protein, partial [Lamprocystis sp. (in: g-proteobacteria)]|nr:aldolase catalytic domain-containing protein [Lamprocystis sp. (in: g-proteobacteria)]
MSEKAPWITYRPELKVLDCTVRDGGLVNAHQFSDEFVGAVYRACVAAGLDYMEIGYKNTPRIFPKGKFGPWRHCDETDLRRVVGDHDAATTGLKLAAMADAGKSDWQTQIVACADSPLDVIRVAFYAHQVSEAVEMIHHCHELGYETTANLMAVSAITEEEIDTVLGAIAETPVGTMVIVDSFGYLYREQIDRLYKTYTAALAGRGKEIGIHAHNNQQLAFANTIEAIILGCNRVDATLFGFGRGAGNCHTELLLGFLRNPKFNLRPIIEVIQNQVAPLRKDLFWGPSIPYNITGQLNRHPSSAIEWTEG